MKRKFRVTVGEVQFFDQYQCFYGRINGKKVKINQVTDKEGKAKWLVSEELEVWEIDEEQSNQNRT